MAKKRRFNNTDASGRRITEYYVKLTFNMLTSTAWEALSPQARCIYIALRHRYNGSNNGEIPLSCREAAKIIHGSKGTACKKFRELADHGFIKPNAVGKFTYKEATTWILTNEVYNNQSPTNEWKQWALQKRNEVPVCEPRVPVRAL